MSREFILALKIYLPIKKRKSFDFPDFSHKKRHLLKFRHKIFDRETQIRTHVRRGVKVPQSCFTSKKIEGFIDFPNLDIKIMTSVKLENNIFYIQSVLLVYLLYQMEIGYMTFNYHKMNAGCNRNWIRKKHMLNNPTPIRCRAVVL